jgi:hypothetical protein
VIAKSLLLLDATKLRGLLQAILLAIKLNRSLLRSIAPL